MGVEILCAQWAMKEEEKSPPKHLFQRREGEKLQGDKDKDLRGTTSGMTLREQWLHCQVSLQTGLPFEQIQHLYVQLCPTPDVGKKEEIQRLSRPITWASARAGEHRWIWIMKVPPLCALPAPRNPETFRLPPYKAPQNGRDLVSSVGETIREDKQVPNTEHRERHKT